MAKIELPEGWAGVAEPLPALMAEVEREAHADRTTRCFAHRLESWNTTPSPSGKYKRTIRLYTLVGKTA